jgi:hypothetical protein
LIGLSLVAAAILASWLVVQDLPTISPPADVGSSVEAPGSTAVHPADRKFYTNQYAIGSGESKAIDPLANLDPADRKFYANQYLTGSGESKAIDPLANVDPADRKFYANGYEAGSLSGDVDSLANVDPADRKFFTNGGYGSDTR